MQTLKTVMSPHVKVISPEATISEAAKQMRDGGFGMLPVGENDRMIGAISDRDLTVRALAEGKSGNTKIREIMSPGIVWAYESDSVEEGARVMSEHQVRRLPIVNSEKRLVGIVSLGDFAVESADLHAVGATLSEISVPAFK
ncbi:CBS domain-containing protein [Oxalicibacterium faecigallinarum]|uniref:CBS domain-containing protein n=1 Tax=Oxalicibacterium faecigallinarum TaxID=573741 RepID=A0A8J3AY90_9BURK|nr:CBS domain-containing protein [Oxalicibacterium faecigallinarum]GGI19436.1 CBS domain-containing protein [Oxalicibacterium faecigallinarum]